MAKTKTKTRTVKFLQFPYYKTIEAPFHPDGSQVVERYASQGEEVEFEFDADLARGEDLGAFYSKEELKVLAAPPEEAEAPGEPASLPDFDIMSAHDVADWLDETNATVPEVLDIVNANPALAETFIEAEGMAHGGDPRSSLIDGLEKVMAANAS
jgi:hypothetical protein